MNIKSLINPFQVGGPTQDPADFIGRRKDIQTLVNAMLKLQNISLHSERRTGKTSLLLYLTHIDSSSIISLPESHIPVYFNFQDFAEANTVKVWQAIAEAIADQIEKRHPDGQVESERFLSITAEFLDSSTPELFGTGFGRAFSYFRASNFKFHLLFDEFDQTARNPGLGDSFYDTLRGLPTRSNNISYIIATRTGLAALQPNLNKISSPFFNIFTSVTLAPFQEDEVYDLIYEYFTRAGLDISEAEKLCAELSFLYDVTGYHPFFLQMLCSHLCEELDNPEWPVGEARQKALLSFEKDSEPYFKYYWDVSSKKEQELIKKLITKKVIDWKKPENMALAVKLKDRCLVVQERESKDSWKVFSSVFSKWISIVDINNIQKILEGLSKRMNEIPRIYIPIARFLKQMSKQRIDEDEEIFLDVVNSFIAGDLSGEAFARMWQEMDVALKKGPNYDLLAERLIRGEIIPFLGYEALHLSGLPMPSPDELVEKLAEKIEYRDFAGSLPMISQYYQMEYSRGTLVRTVKQVSEPGCGILQSDILFNFLGNIDNPILVISTYYDDVIERIFNENKKKYVVISHQIHLRTDHDFGKVFLKYSNEDEPRKLCTAESVSELNLLEHGYSVVYKICGCFSLCNTDAVGKPDPLIISEDDFFNFSRHLEKVIPDYLVKHMSQRSLLYLGYNLEKWQDRLIANAILEKKRTRREPSYAVHEEPTLYEKAFWKFNGVDIYEVEPGKFVSELCKRIPGLKKEKASKMKQKFDVYLCHNSQDKPFVKEIGTKLKDDGLRPWLEEWELRSGMHWQLVLEEQIENIRAVAVFVGETGIGPWQNMEQEAFLRQFVDRRCPVIPVILPECKNEPKLPVFLSGMTWVDFRKDDPDPMDQLIWGITGKRATVI
ncbi:MAG: TIR domain-containing protein [Desulfobacteraceae bacterium]|nr:TIR domain-containing protein [Desulfobacteraceae bacterium]